ncbi:hypothetical protein EUGRSUZ_L01430 [Eucalyptus grandis]|uniref:Uncharacterized protein n=1 Tax=Eucalyptus grandis TaxID=71139 RepID=A0A058ZT82_EUCGR|nr:hypothetical protein EUGRSUZ_L01430 [Eucalyptus grandis]
MSARESWETRKLVKPNKGIESGRGALTHSSTVFLATDSIIKCYRAEHGNGVEVVDFVVNLHGNTLPIRSQSRRREFPHPEEEASGNAKETQMPRVPQASYAAAPRGRRAPLKLDWTVRQRRSSNSKTAPKDARRKKRGGEPARASPTTPLSWSGATSSGGGGGGGGGGSGGGGGGDEECSVPVVRSPEKARSKTTNGSTTTSAARPSKRPRKKKTLAELKEEENKLLKERRRLKWGLANLRRVVEKQRIANESLKKMKEAVTTPDEQPQNVGSCSPCSSASKTREVETCERFFELPDLNLPVENSG